MAPEYAIRGYLIDKVDAYSFGVVASEIVSRKKKQKLQAIGRVCLPPWRVR